MIIAATMFMPLKFIHPVRTERWRMISLPVTMIWTALSGYAAWHDFNIGHTAIFALSITSIYLMFAGIAQQFLDKDLPKIASK